MPTLDWIGKDKVINHHQEVPFRILERQYSYDEKGWHEKNNQSGNMIIHGDNLGGCISQAGGARLNSAVKLKTLIVEIINFNFKGR